jgi:hypothetical protein
VIQHYRQVDNSKQRKQQVSNQGLDGVTRRMCPNIDNGYSIPFFAEALPIGHAIGE